MWEHELEDSIKNMDKVGKVEGIGGAFAKRGQKDENDVVTIV